MGRRSLSGYIAHHHYGCVKACTSGLKAKQMAGLELPANIYMIRSARSELSPRSYRPIDRGLYQPAAVLYVFQEAVNAVLGDYEYHRRRDMKKFYDHLAAYTEGITAQHLNRNGALFAQILRGLLNLDDVGRMSVSESSDPHILHNLLSYSTASYLSLLLFECLRRSMARWIRSLTTLSRRNTL